LTPTVKPAIFSTLWPHSDFLKTAASSLKKEANSMAMTAPALRADLRVRLVNRAFEGIEVLHFERLRRTVPLEYRDRDELRQQVSVFCLEAIELFDSGRNTKFSTFLCGHLRLRCGNYQQYLWTRSSGNERCRMLPLVQRKPVGDFGELGPEGPNDIVHDDGESSEDALCTDSRVESAASVNELLAALSDEAREYLTYLLHHEDQERLVAAFRTKHFRSKVALITGLTKRQISAVATEVRKKFMRHLE
jgi:hypothetical protein